MGVQNDIQGVPFKTQPKKVQNLYGINKFTFKIKKKFKYVNVEKAFPTEFYRLRRQNIFLKTFQVYLYNISYFCSHSLLQLIAIFWSALKNFVFQYSTPTGEGVIRGLSVVVATICDMSMSHRELSYHKRTSLVMFLLKSKDQKNSGER